MMLLLENKLNFLQVQNNKAYNLFNWRPGQESNLRPAP
jgi:hypothetical protein